jgi:hypothetical protein
VFGGSGNGYGTNGSALVCNATGSFAGLNLGAADAMLAALTRLDTPPLLIRHHPGSAIAPRVTQEV